MKALIRHEFALNRKNLLLWALIVGGMGFVCILLYNSMKDEIAGMADSFASMGAFADAFGMTSLSIATAEGFFATEVGTIHGLGSGMFAAVLATVALSREEDGHTGEFLFALPISRRNAVLAKALVILAELVLFTVICGVFYWVGFFCLGEKVAYGKLGIFLLRQLLMNLEIAAICLLISAFTKRNLLGAGFGVAVLCYGFDLMARAVPDLKKVIEIGPYSYANAADVFSGKECSALALVICMIVLIGCTTGAFVRYLSKDLAG